MTCPIAGDSTHAAIADVAVLPLPIIRVFESELDAWHIRVIQLDGRKIRITVDAGFVPIEHRGVGYHKFLRPHIAGRTVRLNCFLQWHGQTEASPSRVKRFEKTFKIGFSYLMLVVRPIIKA